MLRKVILQNLPEGYVESNNAGILSYEIPLSRYPTTHNGKPLPLAVLAPHKNYMSLYLMAVYGDQETAEWFQKAFISSGKRLNMGKSCVRFKTLSDLPLDVIGRAIRRVSLAQYIRIYEAARRR